MDKVIIPKEVLRPGNEENFIPVANHPPTNTASLGYSLLRALGVCELMSDEDLEFIQNWSDCFSRNHGRVTPQKKTLVKETFKVRMGLKYCSLDADKNATCYPGLEKLSRPSYREIFSEVWDEQKWPELCNVIARHYLR